MRPKEYRIKELLRKKGLDGAIVSSPENFHYVTGVAMGLGAIGVWIAMIIDWIVRISFFVTRFFSGKWKTFYHGE